MVTVTIFIEGGDPGLVPEAKTVNSNVFFREAFHTLIVSAIEKQSDIYNINLVIDSFGTITQTKNILKKTRTNGSNSLILIDLDAPKIEKGIRLNYYSEQDWERIFFMIQEMEAWIISQPDKIEKYGIGKKFVRKKPDKALKDDPSIRGKHPETLSKPSEKLDVLFRKYFDAYRNGKLKGVRYSKSKDGPDLISLLNSKELLVLFDEFRMLIQNINTSK